MSRGRAILIALAGGLGSGLAARLLFEVLPEPWDTLANTSALWGLLPFATTLGVRARGWFAVAMGAASLAAMVACWVLLSPAAVPLREIALWAVVAVAAGALCGFAGGLIRNNGPWPRRVALAFMGGIVAGEGVYGLLLIAGPQWWLELAIGLLVPLSIGRSWRDRMLGLAGASVIACALFGAYLLYDAVAVL